MTASSGHRPALRRRGSARVIAADPTPSADARADGGLIERPDGWYWVSPDGRQEFGPFETGTLARADRDRDNEQAPSEGETLREAEGELGIGDWIDAETGTPAEGQSPPHLDEEG